MKKDYIFISCSEAKEICDKSQYGEASIWEKFKLKLRILYCHVTRNYVKKNSRLTTTCKEAKMQCMHPKEKEQLRQKINSSLEK